MCANRQDAKQDRKDSEQMAPCRDDDAMSSIALYTQKVREETLRLRHRNSPQERINLELYIESEDDGVSV